jgi:hypothetical protein
MGAPGRSVIDGIEKHTATALASIAMLEQAPVEEQTPVEIASPA